MFSAQIIAIAFISMMVLMYFFALDARKWKRLVCVTSALSIVTGLYCVASGLWLAVDWVDPLLNSDPQQLQDVTSSSRGRGGVVVMAIRFWPFLLMIMGALSMSAGYKTLMRVRQ